MSEKRCKRIGIRVTEQEYQLIKDMSKFAELPISKFMLRSLFETNFITYEIDVEPIKKILQGLQRHYNTIRYSTLVKHEKEKIVNEQIESEITKLWQLLALARQPKV